MARRAVGGGVAILLVGACLNTHEPTARAFRYQVSAYACGTTCATPGSTAIASAARGDTVWLEHLVELVAALDSVTPEVATLRPDCTENVVVVSGATTVRSIPTPATCPDSTYRLGFTLKGIDWPSSISRYTMWVVDAGVAPGTYGLRGRVMVQPQLEPFLGFVIN